MRLHRMDMGKLEKSSKTRRVRSLILFIALELCFAFLIYRLFLLQCIQSKSLREQALEQYRREICIGAKRGNIYDRNLQSLAINLKTYSLYADPSILKDRGSTAISLSNILNTPREEVLQKLETKRRFVWMKRQMPEQIAGEIGSLSIRGLGFKEEEKRFYPKGSLAAHVLGFVGFDNIGLDGVEKAYDQYMRGNFQEVVGRRDRKGRNLVPQESGFDDLTRGHDVVLTVDEVVQNIVEAELRRACWKAQAESGSVIIMNPQTGEILALANYPTYDLNSAFSAGDYRKRNRAIRDLYEPGSAFKILTAAAALNENVVTLGEKIDCENGVYNCDGYTIHDHGKHDRLTFSEVVERSSNIGMVKVASRLGKERLYSYIEAFGFRERTGLDLYDRSGFVRPPEKWTKQSMASIPFGQEIAVTPLQMLCLANTIANGGIMMKPFIVQRIVDDQKTLMEFSSQEIRRPISNDTATILKQVLTRAVENGTGRNARIDGYKVAGKTGTAQKASKTGGYLPDKYISSFVGFVSAGEFTISMIVVIDEPNGDHTGGIVACPVFKEIAKQVMQYLSIGQRFYADRTDSAGR